MKKNVIFSTVIPLWSMNNGSGGRALYSTIEAYVKNGYNVYLVTDQENNYQDSNIDLKEENIFYIDMKWKEKLLKHKIMNVWGMRKIVNWLYCFRYNSKSYKAMKKILKQCNEALIYAYEVNAVRSCKKISKKYKMPLITRFQGTIMSKFENNFYTKITRYPHIQALSTKADLIIMTDDGTQGDRILKEYGNNSKTLFLKNGVNILSRELPEINKEEFKKSINVPLDKVILLTVSRLVDWKKVDRSIRALSKIKDKEKYFLLIVGEGDERKNLENLIKELNLEDSVRLVGAVRNEDVYKYMTIADIFLSFYDLSNVGNPLLEALSLGKPIITYNVGDTNKVINGKNGVLLDDVSPENIARAIENINNKQQLKFYSDGAKEYTKNNLYSWNKRMEMEIEEVEKLTK